MSGKALKDKFRKEIRRYIRITYVEDKIIKKWLTWYGHAIRRLPSVPISCLNMPIRNVDETDRLLKT